SKTNYPIMVAMSKIGGMCMAFMGCWFLSRPACCATLQAQITTHQCLLGISSACVLLLAACIFVLIRIVPQKDLHGYEAAYRAEKEEKKFVETPEKSSFFSSIYSMFSGLIFLLRYPYALGLFAITFFWEIINS